MRPAARAALKACGIAADEMDAIKRLVIDWVGADRVSIALEPGRGAVIRVFLDNRTDWPPHRRKESEPIAVGTTHRGILAQLKIWRNAQ